MSKIKKVKGRRRTTIGERTIVDSDEIPIMLIDIKTKKVMDSKEIDKIERKGKEKQEKEKKEKQEKEKKEKDEKEAK
ncbi:hypothetical protein ES703_49600 [subsurface metagenome]